MKYNIENEIVNKILNELSEEYKNLLIEKALSKHNEYDINQINLPTLIRLDEKAKDSLIINERKCKKNRLLSIISILGLIYTLFGLAILFFNEIDRAIKYDPMIMMSLLSIFVGLFSSLLSILIKNSSYMLHSKNKDTSKHFNYEIVNTWKQIESLLIQITPVEESTTINGMITNLLELNLLSANDNISIKKILDLRNQIVHSNVIEKKYTTSEIQSLLGDANDIIKKLKKFENT